MKHLRLLVATLGVAAAVVGGSIALAQHLMPFLLNAKITSDGRVALAWTKPSGTTVSHYLVYRAQVPETTAVALAMPDFIHFTRIDSTTQTEYLDTPPAPVPGMVLFYYVEAKLSSGISLRSNIAVVRFWGTLHARDRVRIISDPVRAAVVGTLYTYQVVAVSSDSAAVLSYSLEAPPVGMSISSSGLVSWTPASVGIFRVRVKVSSSKGGSTHQQYVLIVSGISSSVVGTVRDTAGNPVARVMVKLYRRDPSRHYEYSAVTDSTGAYAINRVDLGTYFARAVPLRPDFQPQWYDLVSNIHEATPIAVNDANPVVINFTLRARAAAVHYTVSGSVQDTAGNPVTEANVFFARAGFSLNGSGAGDAFQDDDPRELFDLAQSDVRGAAAGVLGSATAALGMDFRLDGNSAFVFKARVDSAGQYALRLPAGAYIAFAAAKGYAKTFYEGKSDPLTADVITLNADVSGIDLVLHRLPVVATGTINGMVIDSVSKAGVAARIIAFRLRGAGPVSLNVPRTHHTDTDSLGEYSLTDLSPGDYLILAVPLGHYIPSFYSTSGPTMRWSEATKVSVNGNTIAGIDIIVVPRGRSRTGYTAVNGRVTSSSGPSATMRKATEAGVDGALVYAVDPATNTVAGYGVTDGSGSFTISELAPGSYSVTVDKFEYTSGTRTASPSYDANGNPVPAEVSYTLDPLVTGMKNERLLPSEYRLEQNYPNPFNPSTRIVLEIPRDEKVTLVIYNILGQRIITLIDGPLSAGRHVVEWDGRDRSGVRLASGVYFYRLSTNSFVAARRMVLLQ